MYQITSCDLVLSDYPEANYYHPPRMGGFIEVPRNPRTGTTWDDIVHEVCHWLVATPEERDSENYGMPWEPNDGCGVVLCPATRRLRERQTCWCQVELLGIWGCPELAPPRVVELARDCSLKRWTPPDLRPLLGLFLQEGSD